MKMDEIKEVIKELAKSQGFYGRTLATMEVMEEFYPTDYEGLVEELENQHFRDALDVIMFFES